MIRRLRYLPLLCCLCLIFFCSKAEAKTVSLQYIAGYVMKTYQAEIAAGHYTQMGHNENGITAAIGMYQIIKKTIGKKNVYFLNEDGEKVTSITIAKGQSAKICYICTLKVTVE